MRQQSDRRRHAAAWLSCLILGAALYSGVTAGAQSPQLVVPAQTAVRCRVEGRVTSGGSPLPGASVIVHVGDALKVATSTDIDGKYTILFAPNSAYRISADLTEFSQAERDLTLGVG